jgi:hypothetical protein
MERAAAGDTGGGDEDAIAQVAAATAPKERSVSDDVASLTELVAVAGTAVSAPFFVARHWRPSVNPQAVQSGDVLSSTLKGGMYAARGRSTSSGRSASKSTRSLIHLGRTFNHAPYCTTYRWHLQHHHQSPAHKLADARRKRGKARLAGAVETHQQVPAPDPVLPRLNSNPASLLLLGVRPGR